MSWQTNYLQFKSQSALESLAANQLREKSYSNFINEGLPTKKDEAWKFTSLNSFKEIEWSTHQEAETYLTHEQMQQISNQLPSDFVNFVFVNGKLNATLSDDHENILEMAEIEEADFVFNENNVEKRIQSLAQAFLNKKINLKIAKNKTIETPMQIVFVQSSPNSVYLSEKLNITLEENSELKLIINTISFKNASADALNLSVNINCKQNSRLNFIQLQNEDSASFHFSQCAIELESNVQLTSLVLSLGNRLIRNYYELSYRGQNALGQVYGLTLGDEDQHVDNYTFINHCIGGNQSIQHYKSILSGSSHSVFRGRVLIEPKSQKANSEQLNNNLLLTRQAQADSIPQLEIFADDVKASHGSTVGQLDKDEIFYFLSRGINQFEAVKMLANGYATELILKFENPLIRNFLIQALNTKLEKMVQNA